MKNEYIRIGVLVSLLYVGTLFLIAIIVATQQDQTWMDLNEWGDYFAGSLQILALGWFVATLVLQAKELSAQREELRLTRSEMKEAREVWSAQQAEQKRLAIATEEANKLAAKGQFFVQLPLLINSIETSVGGMIGDLRIVPEEELGGQKNPWRKLFSNVHRMSIENENPITSFLLIKEKIDAPGNPVFVEDDMNWVIELLVNKSPDFQIFRSALKHLIDEANAIRMGHLIPTEILECANMLNIANAPE